MSQNRKVHRVREFWLHSVASENLDLLRAYRISRKNLSDYLVEANKANAKFNPSIVQGTIDEFFRPVEELKKKYLTIKLSTKLQYERPSKNVLKRWNLANGMLYFFYSVLAIPPPSPETILETFHAQKRLDFIRKCCGSLTSPEKKRKRSPSEKEAQNPIKKEHLSVKIKPNLENLTKYLRICDSKTGILVSEDEVRVAVEEGIWQWDESSEAWIPHLDRFHRWTFENGALQVFGRACRRDWRSLKQLWDSWIADLGHNAPQAFESLFRCRETDVVDDIVFSDAQAEPCKLLGMSWGPLPKVEVVPIVPISNNAHAYILDAEMSPKAPSEQAEVGWNGQNPRHETKYPKMVQCDPLSFPKKQDSREEPPIYSSRGRLVKVKRVLW